MDDGHRGRGRSTLRRRGKSWAGGLGVAGSTACVASMVSVGVGVGVGVGAAATATGMAAMSGTGPDAPGGALGVLLRPGPVLLVVSVVLVTAAFVLSRRPVAAVPALLAGGVLYAVVYAQPDLTVMYLGIAAGYLVWAGLYRWVRTARPHRPRTPPRADRTCRTSPCPRCPPVTVIRGAGLRAGFTHPGYRRLWAARTASQAGDVFDTVALSLLVLQLTGSGFGVSAVVLAGILPVLVLAPLAGTLVHRFPRVRLMIGADLLRAGLAGALPFVAGNTAAVYAGRVWDVGRGGGVQPGRELHRRHAGR